MSDSPCYVLDTGYLDELWKVEGKFTETKHLVIKACFQRAIDMRADFLVPVAVIFELANHIAQVKNKVRRRELADQFKKTVLQCLEDDIPWRIVPDETGQLFSNLNDALRSSVERFAAEFSEQKISLTDTTVLLTAERFKSLNKRRKVHIWTVDHALKALEPDQEANPV